MGFMDEIRKLTHPYSEQEEEYDDYDDEPLEEENPAPAPTRRTFGKSASAEPKPAANRVVNFSNTSKPVEVVLQHMERFERIEEIGDLLRANKSVILNLDKTDTAVARRIVDFLSGCTYGMGGDLKKVASRTFLVTPNHVSVTGSVELEDIYFDRS